MALARSYVVVLAAAAILVALIGLVWIAVVVPHWIIASDSRSLAPADRQRAADELSTMVAALPASARPAAASDVRLLAGRITATDQISAENGLRTSLAQLLAGVFASLALVFTARTFGLQRRGQVTDRLARAIEQLGKSGDLLMHTRIGAIYALEQVANDSDQLHWPVMEMLTAFIRSSSPAPEDPDAVYAALNRQPQRRERTLPPEAAREPTLGLKPSPDVQAALTVICRRRIRRDRGHRLDLTGVWLVGTDLSGGRLSNARLDGSVFYGAVTDRADLTNASRSGALGLP